VRVLTQHFLATADAQRDQAALATVAPHQVNEFCREHRARRANRVAVGGRTALDIHTTSSANPSSRATTMAMGAKASLISTLDRTQPARKPPLTLWP
jgi:hypothetical protein